MPTGFIAAVCAVLLFTVATATASGKTVTDLLGRQVSVPYPVKRIVTLGGALRLVVYLQSLETVVGVEAAETRPGPVSVRPYQRIVRRQASKLPVVADGLQKQINHEAIIAARPDLIVVAELDRARVEHLSRITKIPVVAVSYGGTGQLDMDVFNRSVLLLGQLFRKEKRSLELVKYISDSRADLAKRSAGGGSPVVYVGGIGLRGVHGITSTDTGYFPVEAVKASNVAKRTGKSGHLFLDKEQLIVWNPPLILVDSGGLAMLGEDYSRSSTFYHGLSAVQNGRVYLVPSYNSYYTNVEIALANAWFLGSILYPERFRDVNIPARMDEIFRVFNNINCYKLLEKEFGCYRKLIFSNGSLHVR